MLELKEKLVTQVDLTGLSETEMNLLYQAWQMFMSDYHNDQEFFEEWVKDDKEIARIDGIFEKYLR